MRNLITLLIVGLFLMVIVPIQNSSAQEDMTIDSTFWFHGTVKDSNGNPIPGITVRCTNCYPPIQTVTPANGEWYLTYHSFCDRKYIEAFGEGWEEETKSVTDGSCPECCADDDQWCIDNSQCQWDKVVNFTLNHDNNQDIDGDGLLNAYDNCPTKPNWLTLGTCTSGRRGNLCTNHRTCDKCGVVGYCSKFQEDCDGNGVGDACDVCVTQPDGCSNCNYTMSASSNAIHDMLSEIKITKMNDDEVRTMWYIIADLWWQSHNYTSYDNIVQAIFGRFNGPDILCKECVHDFNENGICDEEEGGIPLHIQLNPRMMLEALINAYQYCRTVKLPECDPEEDPFGCMW